jgi:hypothetical protein
MGSYHVACLASRDLLESVQGGGPEVEGSFG